MTTTPSEQPAIPASAGGAEAGYADVFYDIAGLLGIGARTASPKEVWEREMRPKLEAALRPVEQPAQASEVERIKAALRAIVWSDPRTAFQDHWFAEGKAALAALNPSQERAEP